MNTNLIVVKNLLIQIYFRSDLVDHLARTITSYWSQSDRASHGLTEHLSFWGLGLRLITAERSPAFLVLSTNPDSVLFSAQSINDSCCRFKVFYFPMVFIYYKEFTVLSTIRSLLRNEGTHAINCLHSVYVQSCVKSSLLSWEKFCQSFRKWQMGRERQASPPWQHWGGKILTCRNHFTHRCIAAAIHQEVSDKLDPYVRTV